MTIDVQSMTTQEIEEFDWNSLSLEDKKIAIKQLTAESAVYKTLEQGKKLVLNSIYGAMANRYSYFYDKSLAEAITLQGRDAIKYAERIIDYYFHNVFHKDKQLLEKLKEKCPDINMSPEPCSKPFVVYMDTDSAYISFAEAADKIGWTGTANDLVLTIDEYRMKSYLKSAFDKYAKKFNTENYLDFELETINRSGIWATKKKYIQDISWEDGKVYEQNEYIKSTGLEIIRKNTPSFCRPELVKLVGWIFENPHFTQRDITIELLNLKKRFQIADTEEICFNTGIGDYGKYILDDKDVFTVQSGCSPHLRGAGLYNFVLNNDSKYDKKYEKIKTGDRVLWYWAKTLRDSENAFSYKRGQFPKEFAKPIDYDEMFEKTVINPINNIIKSMQGVEKLSGSLKVKRKLF